jgi:hypothetical protein
MLGFLDENCKLLDNYNIIFLGDIVDRGQYGFEIVMIIFLLKLLNPNGIHMNRGNHEDISQNKSDGFYNDIENKFVDPANPANPAKVFNLINETFICEHSALLIKKPNSDRYIYLAHGGLPVSFESINQLRQQIQNTNLCERIYINVPQITPEQKKISDEHILPDNLFSNFDAEGNIIVKDEDIQLEMINSTYRFPTNSIRWGDFWGFNNSQKFITRGGGRSNIQGKNAIIRARQKKIDLIIRGHQDSGFNFKLIEKKNSDSIISIGEVDQNNSGFRSINEYPGFGIDLANQAQQINCYQFTHLISVNGEENIMILNNIPQPNLLPVITVSTNTDINRDLTMDSFAILNFTDTNNIPNNNCVIVDSEQEKQLKIIRIENRIKKIDELIPTLEDVTRRGELTHEKEELITRLQALNPHNGGFYEKYMKYKAKYLALKRLSI